MVMNFVSRETHFTHVKILFWNGKEYDVLLFALLLSIFMLAYFFLLDEQNWFRSSKFRKHLFYELRLTMPHILPTFSKLPVFNQR